MFGSEMEKFTSRANAWQRQQEQEEAYRRAQAAQAALDAAQSQRDNRGIGLGSILGGIANSVSNVGKGLADMFGSGAASVRDIVTGNAATGKYAKEWREHAKENLYGNKDMSDKDYFNKSGGTALDAAATVSDFIPGIGAAGRAAMNVGQGAVSGIAQNFIDNGENATFEGGLNNALVGAASAGVGNMVGGKLAKAGGNSLLAKAARSNVGRGALTGAAAGATGAGLQTALYSDPENFNLAQVLGNAAQGAAAGGAAGGIMSGAMGLAGAGVDKVKNKLQGNTDVQNIADNVAEAPVGNATRRRQAALGWDGEEIDASKRNALQSAGKALEDAGERTKNADVYGKLNNNTARQVEANDTINRLKKEYGYTAKDYDKAANLSEATNRWISNEAKSSGASGIDNDLIGKVALDDSYVSLTDKQAKSYSKMARKLLDEAQVPGGTIDEYSAAGLYDAAEKAGKLANTYYEKSHNKMDGSVINVELDELSNAYRNLKNQARASADNMLGGQIDDVTRNNLRTMLKNAGAPDAAVKTLSNAKSLSELKSLTSPLESARNMNAQISQTMLKRGATTNNSTNPVTIAANKAGATQLIDAVASPIGGAVGNVEKFAGKLIGGLGDVAAGKGSALGGKVGRVGAALNNQTLSGALGGIATRQISRQAGLQSGLDQLYRKNDQENVDNAQTNFDTAYADYMNATNAANEANLAVQQATSQNPQLESQMAMLEDSMQAALSAGDLKSYATLADLYKDAYSIYSAQAKAAATETKQEKLTDNQAKALTGLEQLQQLEAMTPGVGTALSNSPLGGIVDILGGDDYANQAQSLALTLGYLQSGSNVTPNEAARIGRSYIPTATDSESVRRSKLQRARALLQNYAQGAA